MILTMILSVNDPVADKDYILRKIRKQVETIGSHFCKGFYVLHIAFRDAEAFANGSIKIRMEVSSLIVEQEDTKAFLKYLFSISCLRSSVNVSTVY